MQDSTVQQDTPDVYYSEIYLEVISILVTSLDSRFETDAKTMLEAVENFILHNDEEALNRICEFYGRDLDRSRLSLHRQMFFDIIRHKSQNVHTFETVLLMFRNDSKFGDMLSELHKLLRIVLTVPITTCTAELSFSALRRLKKFLAYPSGKTSSCRKGNCHWVSCGVLRCPVVSCGVSCGVLRSDCNSGNSDFRISGNSVFSPSPEIPEFFKQKFRKFVTSFFALLALSCLFCAVSQ